MAQCDSTILVADDDDGSSRAIEKILAKDGHSCLRAADGREALRLFAERKPDLVILDVMMPFLDGFQVCDRIREQRRYCFLQPRAISLTSESATALAPTIIW